MNSNTATTRASYKSAGTTVAVLGFLGLWAGVSLAWVAGSLGISTSAASQIVSAIQTGGMALTIVMAVFGGGVISAIIATVRYMLTKKAKAVVVA